MKNLRIASIAFHEHFGRNLIDLIEELESFVDEDELEERREEAKNLPF